MNDTDFSQQQSILRFRLARTEALRTAQVFCAGVIVGTLGAGLIFVAWASMIIK